MWNLRQGRFTEPLLLLVWAHAALLAARNIPIFMIAAAPPVAAAIQQWLQRLPEWNVAGWLQHGGRQFNRRGRGNRRDRRDRPRWHLASALGLLLVAALVYAPHPPKKFRAEFDPKRYPAGGPGHAAQRPDRRGFSPTTNGATI